MQKQVSTAEVQALFKAIQWIGVSAYAGLPQNLNINDLEKSIQRVRLLVLKRDGLSVYGCLLCVLCLKHVCLCKVAWLAYNRQKPSRAGFHATRL